MCQNIHVTPRPDGKWQVKSERNTRATSITKTQQEAINIAIELAKTRRCEVLIHGLDGRIRQKNSYGNDPYPPKG